MSDVKGVGNKSVSQAGTDSSQSKTQQTSSVPRQDVAAQSLSSHAKVAKTTESQITGTIMRQALLKSVAGPKSPAGVHYKPEARVPDNTPIFTDGEIDREKVLQSLSQHNQNPKTTEDKDLCGGTAAIASAINSDGDKGLLKLTDAMKKNLPSSSLNDLSEIENKIQDKTASHGDLVKLSELIHERFSVADPKHGKGILDKDMYSLYTEAGLTPPTQGGSPSEIFQNGQSWPVNLYTESDGASNHWVVVGKDEKARTFIYDPESTPGKPQIHYKGSPEYDQYIKQMQKTRSGFAPMTKEVADKAREKYDSGP